MNNIPSINSTTAPTTSFKSNAYIDLSKSILRNSALVHADTNGIININFKNFFRFMRENLPWVRPKYLRPTLSDTILINRGKGTSGITKNCLINHEYVTYTRKDPRTNKSVTKVFDNKGRYIRTEHDYYNNHYMIITDSKGHWTIFDTHNLSNVKVGHFKHFNKLFSFVKKNWNIEENTFKPTFFEKDAAKEAVKQS